MNRDIAETEFKRAERKRKRDANELISKSETSSSEVEESEDLSSANNSTDASKLEEEQRTPLQPDLVEDLESPPIFRIGRPVTHSASKPRPIARHKLQASKKKTSRLGSNSRRIPRRKLG